jgi:hypothetical protein
MASAFAKSQFHVYVSATLGNVAAQVAMRGVRGAAGPIDWGEAFLGGLQVGTAFIAYPVAVQLLKNNCPTFKKTFDDPKACKAPIYIQGGILGAGIVTALNYPLSVILGKYRAAGKPAPDFSLAKAAGFYIDQVGSSIGFAATMGTLAPKIPVPKNSLLGWARQSALVNISNIGGRITAWPIHALRHGSTLSGMVLGYLPAVPSVVVCGDATFHFKGILSFLLD